MALAVRLLAEHHRLLDHPIICDNKREGKRRKYQTTFLLIYVDRRILLSLPQVFAFLCFPACDAVIIHNLDGLCGTFLHNFANCIGFDTLGRLILIISRGYLKYA